MATRQQLVLSISLPRMAHKAEQIGNQKMCELSLGPFPFFPSFCPFSAPYSATLFRKWSRSPSRSWPMARRSR